MASSPPLLCGSYRGAVYPVDLHAAPTDVRAEIPRVETLVAVCAEKIVQDSDLTRHAIHNLPKPLRILLMMVCGKEEFQFAMPEAEHTQVADLSF